MMQLEVEVARLENSVKDLAKKQAELSAMITQVQRPVESLNSNLADTQQQLSKFTPQFEEVQSLIKGTKRDLINKMNEHKVSFDTKITLLSTEVKALKVSGGVAKKTTPSKKTGKTANSRAKAKPTPLSIFQAAYNDYLKKRTSLAEKGFKNYLKTYPKGSLADKSLYYLGLIYKSKGKLTDANNNFEEILEKFPKSSVAKSAMLEKAKIFQQQKKYVEAEGMLEYLIITYPKSKEASNAKSLLKKLPGH
ncbi:tol-pal system YbgF family protein [Elusimicrobiota bacterium]